MVSTEQNVFKSTVRASGAVQPQGDAARRNAARWHPTAGRKENWTERHPARAMMTARMR